MTVKGFWWGLKTGFRRGAIAVLTFVATLLISCFFYWLNPDFWVAAGMGPAVVYCVVLTFKFTRARNALARVVGLCQIEPPDLSTQEGRDALDAFLVNQRVLGDANIRRGRVYKIVDPRELPEIVRRLQVLISDLSDGRLPLPLNLYRQVARAEGGWAAEALDLSLCDLVEIASVVERVAEDRRTSVQLYVGITEDEIMGIARTVAASRLRRTGGPDGFALAAEILKGSQDQCEWVQVARATVELIYKIKGAGM